MSRGIIYVATGNKYLQEASVSYISLKAVSNLPCVLYTDEQNENIAKTIFPCVKVIEKPAYNFIDKIAPLINSPFEESLFVDTDTYFIEDISDVFEILNVYDLAASHCLGRIQYHLPKCPEYLPEYNTGIFFFKRTKVTTAFFQSWLDIYKHQLKDKLKVPHDQPAFRQAVYNNQLKIYTLPNEFNFRTESPNVIGRNYTVKVIHGRHTNYEAVSKLINQSPEHARIFMHDLIFLSRKNFGVFNTHQANTSLFGIIIFITRTIHKILIRLNLVKTGSFLKRKGN